MRFSRKQTTFKNGEEMHKHFINDILNYSKRFGITTFPLEKCLIIDTSGKNRGVGENYTLDYNYIKGYKYTIEIWNHKHGEVYVYKEKMIKY